MTRRMQNLYCRYGSIDISRIQPEGIALLFFFCAALTIESLVLQSPKYRQYISITEISQTLFERFPFSLGYIL